MRLLHAIEIGQIGTVTAFLAEGDDVNEMSLSGNTPILEAASRNDTKMVALLLAKGANPDVHDLKNNNPLSWAKKYKNAEMEHLIETAIALKYPQHRP